MRQRRGERDIRCVGKREAAFLHESGPHLREHLSRHAGDDVDAQRWPHAPCDEPAGGGHAVAHQHLDKRRHRRRPACFRDEIEFLISGIGAVDVRRVGSHQAELVERQHVVHVDTGEPHPHVDADADAQVARQLPIVRGHFGRGVARSPGRHGERQQLIVRLKVLFADAPDVLGMLARAVGPPVSADRHAVSVHGPDARVGEALDCRVGMLGRVVDVRPVEQGGDPRVERFERAHQVGDVDVFGAVLEADVVEHPREILVESAAGQHAADGRLPRVAMRIHEARHDDAVAGVDDVGVRAGRQVGAHRGNRVPVDQHIGVRHVAEHRIEGEHVSTPNQRGSIAEDVSADHGRLLRSVLRRLPNPEQHV